MKKQKPNFSLPKPQKNQATEEILQDEIPELYDIQNGDEYGEEDLSSTEPLKFFPEKSYKNLPTVAIAGRPNVGKSTLFNRFMHKRLAIVDPTPGVTRDPVESTAFIDGKPVRLIDTGGFKLDRIEGSREAEMDALVVEKSLSIIKNADAIILLLEAGKITGEDEEFIHILRPYWDKVTVAINKCEGGNGESVSWNYLKYGFSDILFISADHGDRISELAKQVTSKLDFSKVEEGEEEKVIKISIVGKPNTGKSTLSNRLTGTTKSIVSDYAGTTRDVVEGKFSFGKYNFQVLDTAGIRRKAKVKENVEYYSVNRAIKTLDECDIVFLMIDAEQGLAEQDKKICSLAYEKGRGIIFVLNKWDLKEQTKKVYKETVDYIQFMFGQMKFAPILRLSALNGDGVKELMEATVKMYKQLTTKIETSALNKALEDWLFRYPPPASKAIHFKIRYMTQTSVNPIAFRIFATSPDNVPESYVTYLKNRIREDLGFDFIPIMLEMKKSRKKWENRFDER
ncbi:ribosome biogenesis GTPase Der [Treponema pectinovorum]|uniref:ribosome biogenesis GTPase Der n=1 Tax=Treponema pectinovorum TaxID=164 RepID=UPI0011F3A9F0|nr:ribosome biogenesis GTPase Der [Treponema pectinovorum]